MWITALKWLGIVFAVLGALLYVHHLGGEAPRERIEGMVNVQKERDAAEARAQLQRHKNVERTNEENARRAVATQRELARLRELSNRDPIVPAAPAETKRPDLACFDRAELDRSTREFEREVQEIVGKGAACVVDLDAAKGWARGD